MKEGTRIGSGTKKPTTLPTLVVSPKKGRKERKRASLLLE